jgi:hypothetical protein
MPFPFGADDADFTKVHGSHSQGDEMPDQVTAKDSGKSFTPHPAGQFAARCVDTVDLGECVVTFANTPEQLIHKCALVFRTGELNAENGKDIDIAQEFTVSMNEKANLRKFLEAWRGKSYRAEQVQAGVPLDKLVNQWALISVDQKQSAKGRTYSVIKSISPLPDVMPKPTLLPYVRAEYWEEKKAANAKAASEFRAKIGAPPLGAGDDDIGNGADDDDDLPF